jgi:hypothetical protein
MKLYVCYGTFSSPRPGGHPCANAFHALVDAGYDPRVIRTYGLGVLPGIFNFSAGRREVKQLTGDHWVPVLLTDDGTVVEGSEKIVEWARTQQAAKAGATASP